MYIIQYNVKKIQSKKPDIRIPVFLAMEKIRRARAYFAGFEMFRLPWTKPGNVSPIRAMTEAKTLSGEAEASTIRKRLAWRSAQVR